MPMSEAERDAYIAWYKSTHIVDPFYSRPIDLALQRFRDVFISSPTLATFPPIFLDRIIKPTIDSLTIAKYD